jgi:hypothetical protein
MDEKHEDTNSTNGTSVQRDETLADLPWPEPTKDEADSAGAVKGGLGMNYMRKSGELK